MVCLTQFTFSALVWFQEISLLSKDFYFLLQSKTEQNISTTYIEKFYIAMRRMCYKSIATRPYKIFWGSYGSGAKDNWVTSPGMSAKSFQQEGWGDRWKRGSSLTWAPLMGSTCAQAWLPPTTKFPPWSPLLRNSPWASWLQKTFFTLLGKLLDHHYYQCALIKTY